MTASLSFPRVGIYGSDETVTPYSRGCALWPLGYAAAVTEAGGTPIPLEKLYPESSCEGLLEGLDAVLMVAREPGVPGEAGSEERLCRACRAQRLPFLGVDQGLHALNAAFRGSLHLDLARECPEALQHLRLPEPGDRHAIHLEEGTLLFGLYGEEEIVVNSEHRRAVCRVARGFRVSARALDGVVEAIEAETSGWFALGVQWHPASASASGLDIQLFRGLVDACGSRRARPRLAERLQAA